MSAVPSSRVNVIVCDAMGQLIYLYGIARVAFIGGSLVRHGGHNPIEAAATGLPILIGPHDFNFASVVAAFEAAGCLHRVAGAASMERAVRELFEDSARRGVEAERARGVVSANAGATQRIATRLVEALAASGRGSGADHARDRR
jgi:3-deoxy-D-manno-octulosonic-acid transferase